MMIIIVPKKIVLKLYSIFEAKVKRSSKAVVDNTLKGISIVGLAIVGIAFLASSGWGFDYITFKPGTDPPTTATGNCSAYAKPNTDFPQYFNPFSDPDFNTTVRRFTDNVNQANSNHMNIQYTTFSNGNSDNTKVVFGNGVISNLFYDVDGAFLRQDDQFYYVQYGYKGDDEFRWSQDSNKPNIGWFRDKTYFCEYDYSKPQGSRVTMVRNFLDDFPNSPHANYHWMDNNDKGEQSWCNNGECDRYWAFRVNHTDRSGGYEISHLFCYDMKQDRVYPINMQDYYNERGWTNTTPACRWVTMSPSGKYVIAKLYATEDVYKDGVVTTLFQRDELTQSLVPVKDGDNYRDILYGSDTGHPAWGYDAEGNEIFVHCTPLPNVEMVNLDTGVRTRLFQVCADCPDCSSHQIYGGTHVSSSYSRSTDGWFFFTHYGSRSSYETLSWLERELFAIRFSTDPSKVIVWRIAHVPIVPTDYYNQGRAQISQDGKNIYFDCNWMDKGPEIRAEIFRAELPDEWWSEIDSVSQNSPPLPPSGFIIVTP